MSASAASPSATTHWERFGAGGGELPGPSPAFFFAPDRVVKRSRDWGGAGLQAKVADAWHPFCNWTAGWLNVVRGRGIEALESAYLDVIEGRVDPRRRTYSRCDSATLGRWVVTAVQGEVRLAPGRRRRPANPAAARTPCEARRRIRALAPAQALNPSAHRRARRTPAAIIRAARRREASGLPAAGRPAGIPARTARRAQRRRV